MIAECGFLTNPDEADLLQTEEYQERVADALTDGIVTYLRKSIKLFLLLISYSVILTRGS